jgi:hypothetical protein
MRSTSFCFASPVVVFTHGHVAVSRATSVNRIKAIWDPKFPNPVSGELPLSLILYFSLSLSCISITSTSSISSDWDHYGHSHMM